MAPTRQKVALVTGGVNGIGRAISRHLGDDGWRIVVVDVHKDGFDQAFGGSRRNVAFVEGDVGKEETANRAVEAALTKFGRLDALVSNAGLMIRKPIAKLTPAEWHSVIDTNLTATFLLARACEQALRVARGTIVTIASTRAFMSEPNTEAYSASKGGLVALTHALAISLAPDVRVNAVSPGWITTGATSSLRRKDHLQHPAGRVGKPDDIAQIVSWLLDERRSGFVTGANFMIDGGMTRKMIYEE